ncbi:hypothetical protein FIBSPDRAFT_891518 [Athelia psychrophila]|uniref:Uncharacterized protein n=1 Tax=Athelia psychrophila TaxID=1759441 RepID=A0A166JJ48_9AGAM|nr:hypothetical protein FIBSPDRAFT_891518 [Fibularhizoctonia sp. CBS 109695]
MCATITVFLGLYYSQIIFLAYVALASTLACKVFRMVMLCDTIEDPLSTLEIHEMLEMGFETYTITAGSTHTYSEFPLPPGPKSAPCCPRRLCRRRCSRTRAGVLSLIPFMVVVAVADKRTIYTYSSYVVHMRRSSSLTPSSRKQNKGDRVERNPEQLNKTNAIFHSNPVQIAAAMVSGSCLKFHLAGREGGRDVNENKEKDVIVIEVGNSEYYERRENGPRRLKGGAAPITHARRASRRSSSPGRVGEHNRGLWSAALMEVI